MDWLYIIIFLIPLCADIYCRSTYNKYLKVLNKEGLSGLDVAKKILEKNGLGNLYVVKTNGFLSDHYDPTRKTVKLSGDIFDKETVASMAVAAHECGHALQDKENYFFLKLRSMIFPIVNIGTKFSYIVIIIGALMQYMDLIYLGIFLVSLGLIFQLVTLPVEFNASNRAVEELTKLNLTSDETIQGIKKCLKAAALTYVAAVLSSALEVLRLVMIFTDRDHR